MHGPDTNWAIHSFFLNVTHKKRERERGDREESVELCFGQILKLSIKLIESVSLFFWQSINFLTNYPTRDTFAPHLAYSSILQRLFSILTGLGLPSQPSLTPLSLSFKTRTIIEWFMSSVTRYSTKTNSVFFLVVETSSAVFWFGIKMQMDHPDTLWNIPQRLSRLRTTFTGTRLSLNASYV